MSTGRFIGICFKNTDVKMKNFQTLAYRPRKFSRLEQDNLDGKLPTYYVHCGKFFMMFQLEKTISFGLHALTFFLFSFANTAR